jgi:phosphoesterase RecJ-like protein
MPMDQKVKELLTQAKSVVVVSHIRPDGDAVGSLLGFGLALLHAGKQVQMVLEDGMPEKYEFLAGAEHVTRSIDQPFDTLIVVDCSDRERTGTVLEGLKAPDLVVDHHKTNLAFGGLNVVEPKAVATSAILAEKLPLWGLNVDRDVAESLLTGILGDSIGFRTSNMNPETLRIAADLMQKGADLPRIYQKTLLSRSISELRYWPRGLTDIHFEDGLLWTTLTLDDRIKSGYPDNDDADLINLLTSVSGFYIVVLFIEQDRDRVKVSWRSTENIDVSQIAFEYGGGGHAAAAGADIRGSLEAVIEDVLTKTKKLLGNGKPK